MSANSAVPTATWAIDPVHSSIGFGVKHLGVSTYRGSFTGASGTITTANGAVTAIDGTIAIDSILTTDAKLTGHLLAADFFDAATYPEARFVSTSVTAGADDQLAIAGNLTLRGITLPLTLTGEIIGHVVDPYGNTKLGVSARGQIDRTTFGITWNAPLPLANGALALAEKVTLTLEVQAAAQDAAA